MPDAAVNLRETGWTAGVHLEDSAAHRRAQSRSSPHPKKTGFKPSMTSKSWAHAKNKPVTLLRRSKCPYCWENISAHTMTGILTLGTLSAPHAICGLAAGISASLSSYLQSPWTHGAVNAWCLTVLPLLSQPGLHYKHPPANAEGLEGGVQSPSSSGHQFPTPRVCPPG